jgi:excisionase family DNA binding protein
MTANGHMRLQRGKTKKKKTRKRRKIKVIPADKRWLTMEEAADVAGLSRTKLYKHFAEIGAVKKGRRTIVDRQRLDGWMSV